MLQYMSSKNKSIILQVHNIILMPKKNNNDTITLDNLYSYFSKYPSNVLLQVFWF